MTANKTTTIENAVLEESASRILPATLVLVFGVFLVWGVAFAQPAELHNAAHDARHAFAVPCH